LIILITFEFEHSHHQQKHWSQGIDPFAERVHNRPKIIPDPRLGPGPFTIKEWREAELLVLKSVQVESSLNKQADIPLIKVHNEKGLLRVKTTMTIWVDMAGLHNPIALPINHPRTQLIRNIHQSFSQIRA
jgi:hypothetical protein